jgi:Ice-binding-like
MLLAIHERAPMFSYRHSGGLPRHVILRRAAVALGLAAAFAFASAPSALAASTPTVNLGQATGYAVISGTSVANLGDTTVRGDIGAPAQPSGFGPGVLVGNMQVGSADATAYTDMLTAYGEVQARTAGTAFPALPGVTLTPGLYTAEAAVAVAV